MKKLLLILMTGLSFTSCKKTETRSTPTSAVETRAVPQSKIDMIRNWTDHVLDSARKNGYKFGTRGYSELRSAFRIVFK